MNYGELFSSGVSFRGEKFWQGFLAISVLGKWRQESQKLKASLGYAARDTQDPVSRKKNLWQGLGFGFKWGKMGRQENHHSGPDRRDGEELPTNHP